MKQLPPRHSDPLLRFYHLLAVLELVHRLRVVPACSVVVPVTQDVEDPFGIDGFGQDFGGHPCELLRRAVEALRRAACPRGFPCGVCIASSCGAWRRSRARANLALMIGEIPALIRAPEGTPAQNSWVVKTCVQLMANILVKCYSRQDKQQIY